MATSTVGTADLVQALTGGGSVEDAAYAKMANRILEAQNKQAMLDKRVLDANLQRDIMRSRGNFERNSMDLPDMVRHAVMGDMADQLNYGQQSIGHGQKNAGRQQIMDIAGKSEAPPEDMINMIVSAIAGKMLSPGNVRVGEQAEADIGKTTAETGAANALAGQRTAAEAFNQARTTALGDPTTPKIENITGIQHGMLWKDPTEIPVTTDNPGWFTGETTEYLPLSDPRAAKQWAGMDEDEQSAMASYLGPEFMQWRQANIGTRPELADASIAVGAFLAEQMGQGDANTKKPPTRSQLYAPSPEDFTDVETGKATPEEFEAFFGVPYAIARRQAPQ